MINYIILNMETLQSIEQPQFTSTQVNLTKPKSNKKIFQSYVSI